MTTKRNVEVVTVYTPRPDHPMWMDYIPLLRLQRDTARHFGHRHVVMTDVDLGPEFTCIQTVLPSSLMKAMIQGVVIRLICGGNVNIVFVDVDCLINRDLTEAFPDDDGAFDVMLTQRPNEIAPINNGAMYVNAQGFSRAWGFFEHALGLCGDHWGADQEAISRAAMPIPAVGETAKRQGCKIKYVSMKPYNTVPKEKDAEHARIGEKRPFVVHFKGATKEWMDSYAHKYILSR